MKLHELLSVKVVVNLPNDGPFKKKKGVRNRLTDQWKPRNSRNNGKESTDHYDTTTKNTANRRRCGSRYGYCIS